MRTRQELYIGTGVIYTCELEQCSSCHERLRIAYTSKFKTVQTMEERLQIAQRAKHCINPDCALHAGAWGSIKWRQIAPVSCGYGYDVIAQIGWQRQTLQRPFAGMHKDLQTQMGICESQVRALYHYRYLPLLACHERQQLERLKGVAEQTGLILTLDGLAPEGGEPQLWLVRELLSGATLRCGWMSQQDQAAFAAFLRPIADLGLPVSAVLSDKQSGLLPAIAEVFPQAKHALCPIHYLRNVAAPLAEADEAMKVRTPARGSRSPWGMDSAGKRRRTGCFDHHRNVAFARGGASDGSAHLLGGKGHGPNATRILAIFAVVFGICSPSRGIRPCAWQAWSCMPASRKSSNACNV